MKLNLNLLGSGIRPEAFAEKAMEMNRLLHAKTGAGNDYLGWIELPETITAQLGEIKKIASAFRSKFNAIVVVGIGGSYLGAKATIDALSPWFKLTADNPEILYAGHHLDEHYHAHLLDYLKSKNWGIVVISKSGTTTEPAIAFRLLRAAMEKQFGHGEARDRIVAVTDQSKGALRKLADIEGYKTFVIPDDVGGRFSVLTPVGLVPIAMAGINIDELVAGARNAMMKTGPEADYSTNLAAQYAATRAALYDSGKKVEILSNFNPALHFVSEWWKQLYGESEGKDQRGIFPASVDLTTDLHSMGQYIQDGERILFETCLLVANNQPAASVPGMNDDLDQLNYLSGKALQYVNQQAAEGTLLAHHDGGVPILRIDLEALTPFAIGELYYFFEKACGISGYMLGVNPFDQPGVEMYKKNMFALLGKTGFEKETEIIRARFS